MKLSIYCGKQLILDNPYMVFSDCNTLEEFIRNKEFQDLTRGDGQRISHINNENPEENFEYKIFLKQNRDKNPRWWNFIFEGVQGDDRGINPLTKSCSGIILIKCIVNEENEEKIFIITFGSGHSYIEDHLVEENFGLKGVLNSISLQNLHLVDKKNIGSNPREVKEAYSNPTNVKNFDINKMIDKLAFVEGCPEVQDQERLGKKIGGRDSVVVDMLTSFFHLGGLCKTYYQLFLGDNYVSKGFSFIDNYTDKISIEVKEQLNNVLRNAIENDRGNISMSPKDIIQMIEQITQFEVSVGATTQMFDTLNFEMIYHFISGTGRIANLQQFEDKVKIQGKDADGNNLTNKTSLKNYLIFETVLNHEQYILNEGVRYNVKQDYYTSIQTRITQIQTDDVLGNTNYLPYNTITDNGEGAYNLRQGGTNCFSCIDKTLYRGYDSGIEVGDLLYSEDNEHHLIHIKRYSGSATLSHLFAQGRVSYEALRQDNDYFAFFTGSFSTGFPTRPLPSKENIKTVFGIITTKTSLMELPFFSKINLISTVDNLNRLNGEVKFVFIPMEH